MGEGVKHNRKKLAQASDEAVILSREHSAEKLKPRGQKTLRSANEIKGYEVSIFTPESAANYEKDYRNENLRQLYAFSAPKYLIECYKRLANAYPEIRNVRLRQNYERTADDLNVSSNSDWIEHQLFFNFSDPDCYRSESVRYEDDHFGISYLDLAMRLGLDPVEVSRNAKICATFLFARELGRAYYFELQFFEPKLRAIEQKVQNTNEALAQSLPDALRDWAVARKAELAKHKRINSRSNRVASSFAARYIQKYAAEFIYDMRKGESKNGRVQSFVNASLAIPVPENLARFASPQEGSEVQLNSCDADGNLSGLFFLNGRMDGVLKVDESLFLNNSPDSNPHHGRIFVGIPRVRSVAFLPNRNQNGKIHNDIVITGDGGNHYLLQSKPASPLYSEVPFGESREFLSTLNRRIGERIILLRRSLNGARRDEASDQLILNGKLNEELALGGRVNFSPDKSARIRRILRRWRDFYIETINDKGVISVYEIYDHSEK